MFFLNVYLIQSFGYCVKVSKVFFMICRYHHAEMNKDFDFRPQPHCQNPLNIESWQIFNLSENIKLHDSLPHDKLGPSSSESHQNTGTWATGYYPVIKPE